MTYLNDKSSHELCLIIKSISPELSNSSYFNFFRNYLKNIKAKHIIGSLAIVALVGGLLTYYNSSSADVIRIRKILTYDWGTSSTSGTVSDFHEKGEYQKIKKIGDSLTDLKDKKENQEVLNILSKKTFKPGPIKSFLYPFQNISPKQKEIYFEGMINKEGTLDFYPELNWVFKRSVESDYHLIDDYFKGNPYKSFVTYLTGGILGTIPSLVTTFKQRNKKMSQKKKIQNFVNQIKKRNLSIKKVQIKIESIKKKSLRKSK